MAVEDRELRFTPDSYDEEGNLIERGNFQIFAAHVLVNILDCLIAIKEELRKDG